MLFAELQFFEYVIHIEERWHHHPAKTVRGFLDDVGHPAVVTATERKIGLWPPRRGKNEDRRIDHLDVDAQLVHMFDPDTEVAHIPGRLL